jgi:23S rRNA C2498 (ribose-2'-O)-methylase RlmM
MTIQLTGLTKQQHQIADMIWNCESEQDVEQLIQNLPRAYKQDAVTIHQLMIAAVMDQYMEIDPRVTDLINSYRNS